ncbi:uncharacterized protein EKO05_0006924 [Ascochyta rabiei]|uniref:Uncharacterized protein n=1 Tax=Didymella rabiei TaxID=5454 RepID=A0A162Z2P0_DIDRA|nr:uncharacterized protein EKO05_0006924 [Ascochyta rabiei]KZM20366.1 hypothetical protein ST47_g8505 [Ascochyta rabiei]UPX16527.1 hypothetical protein EKO05_0006924 [Ascochyta rabiei]
MKFTLIAAALTATTAADFVVVTAIPTPTDLSQLLNLKSYASSLAGYVTAELASFTAGANPSAISEKAKIQKELASFAATASYSIPSGVTALTGLETFTTVPDWYSALPSDVKSYYDKNNAIVESILFQAVGVNQTGTASGSAGATRSGTGATASQTGAANKVAAMGAGMAAVFLGVVAL